MVTAEDQSLIARRRANFALAAIALAGLVLRLLPFLREGGPLGYPVDYDEGVYFSASALLFQGVIPYRDFVFVHPPGLLYFLGLTSSFARSLDPAGAFAGARVVATFLGALNIYLVGRLAMRSAGPLAGLVAAALYATYPEAVVVERGPYLEPVLNLACLSMALVWLAAKDRSRAPVLSGVLCGLALAVKVWGGIWLLAALASAPRGRARQELPRFLAAATAVALLGVAPLALSAAGAFIEQTLLFHAWRPPDGGIDRLARITEIANGRHLVASILALLGCLAVLWRARVGAVTREERFFAAAWLLTLIAFFASSAYWRQYNSHLAASECILAGLGAAALGRRLATRIPRRTLVPALAAAVFLLAFPSLRRTVLGARSRAPELMALAGAIRSAVPPGDCLFAFEPGWGLVGGRLPEQGGGPVLVDSYAAMLLDAVKPGTRFPDAAQAFQSAASQRGARARLGACRFAVLGWRGDLQLTGEARAWFEAHYLRRETPGTGGLELWERSSP